jgi:hypothetical protein
MEEKNRQQQPQEVLPGGGLGGLFGDDDATGGTVDVAHGPYREALPVGGMTVGEVRRRFSDLLDVHPEAVATLGGNEVGDDTRLRAGQLLMFIRRSGIKGAR